MPGCVAVAQRTLDPLAQVRILARQPSNLGSGVMDWSNWYSLDEESIKANCPQTAGVCKIRQREGEFGRLVGSSDILYIGKSGNLQVELLRYIGKGGDHVLKYRLWPITHRLDRHLQFSFAETELYDKYEDQLLAEYEKEHYEIPPLNRQGTSSWLWGG